MTITRRSWFAALLAPFLPKPKPPTCAITSIITLSNVPPFYADYYVQDPGSQAIIYNFKPPDQY